jgi:hypothetical protein
VLGPGQIFMKPLSRAKLLAIVGGQQYNIVIDGRPPPPPYVKVSLGRPPNVFCYSFRSQPPNGSGGGPAKSSPRFIAPPYILFTFLISIFPLSSFFIFLFYIFPRNGIGVGKGTSLHRFSCFLIGCFNFSVCFLCVE